jgi:GTPase involved in cell partitioning and DNA repair
VVGGAGGPGGKQWKLGAAGKAALVEVPVGTRVWELVPDLALGEDRLVVVDDDDDEEEEEEDEDEEDDDEQPSASSDDDDDDDDDDALSAYAQDHYDDDDDDDAPAPLRAGDSLVRALTSGAVRLSPEDKARLWLRGRLPLALFGGAEVEEDEKEAQDQGDTTTTTTSAYVSFTRPQVLAALEAQAPLLAELGPPPTTAAAASATSAVPRLPSIVIARGGRGGRGNAGSPSKPHGPASRRRESGKPGQRAVLLLRARLLADVALVGAPNAGKSSLLRALCGARAEVGAHPFTTLRPQLGALPPPPDDFVARATTTTSTDDGDNDDSSTNNHDPVTLADVPGLLEGAHRGRGRGIDFLTPLQRASVLAFVIDLSGGGGGGGAEGGGDDDDNDPTAASSSGLGTVPEPPAEQLRVLIDEVRWFDPSLVGPGSAAVVIANKTDAVVAGRRQGGLDAARAALRSLAEAAPRGWPVVPVSALEGAGLPALASALRALVLKQRRRRRDEETGGGG